MTSPTRAIAITALTTISLCLLIGCGGGASATPTGTLTGTIKLIGTAPKPSVIVAKGTAKRDATVCGAQAAIIDQSLQVGEGNGIANVFVYVDKAPPGATIPTAPTEPAIFDQKGCVFLPHAMVVRSSQTVLIKSQDDAGHNTHTYPGRSRGFNGAIKALERDGVPLVYNKHERTPFPVKCDMHSWMQAFHLALEHPWGTTTKADGSFELTGLPATELTLRVWHEKAGGKGGFLQRSLKVTIPKDGSKTENLEFKLSDFGL
ncbi:MAG: hypothetical protein MK004_10910 [Planctomycetales bacterium]|nr:hypothetical protein [Planctomycetales bacterium]